MNDDSIFELDSEYEDRANGPSEFRTENGALTLGTTKDPRVDMFYKTVRGLNEDKLREYLTNSWSANPQDTLRLIFFIRDIRGKGKGEKKLFHQSFRWLMDKHPEAVRHASKHIPFYGSYKDWLEIFLGTRFEKAMLKVLAKQLKMDLELVTDAFRDESEANTDGKTSEEKTEAKKETKKKRKGFFSYIWGSSSSSSSTSETKVVETNVVPTKTETGENKREHVSVSLAWKWAPTENTHYDKGKYAGTVTKICLNLGISKKEYRKACTLMRAHLGVVEGFMCGKKWDEIDFSKVPSRAMHIYKKAYSKHQPERFGNYLKDVISGKTTMNTGVLQPHEIVGQYYSCLSNGYFSSTERADLEAQWVSYISGLEKAGVNFDQSIGVIDTSGSMWSIDGGRPGMVAYSLGLTLAHFCKNPFHNKWIEFSESAKFHKFPEGSLHSKLSSIKSIIQSTNLQSVFDLILSVYTIFDVPVEQQIKRVFIITDGQWNEQTSHAGSTNFLTIDAKFAEGGYKRPQLVFWNVRGNTIDFPTEHNTPNTALVSGFSADLLKLFLKGGDINPLGLVLEAINDPRYERITL
jgi:hypothetical protein